MAQMRHWKSGTLTAFNAQLPISVRRVMRLAAIVCVFMRISRLNQ